MVNHQNPGQPRAGDNRGRVIRSRTRKFALTTDKESLVEEKKLIVIYHIRSHSCHIPHRHSLSSRIGDSDKMDRTELLGWYPTSQRDVALARIKSLESCPNSRIMPSSFCLEHYEAWAHNFGNDGLAGPLVEILSSTFENFLASISLRSKHIEASQFKGDGEEKKDDSEPFLSDVSSAKGMLFVSNPENNNVSLFRQALLLHLNLCRLDLTLAEEMGRAGSHAVLSRLIRFDLEYEVANNVCISIDVQEEDLDTVIELQDIAAEIASLSLSFPVKKFAFTAEELSARLPLCFSVSSADSDNSVGKKTVSQHSILIHQVTDRQGAQEDVGYVMWPSAVALASWIVTNPDCVLGKRILELGSGCGLTGLTAAAILSESMAGACCDSLSSSFPSVILTDFNDKVLQNADRNILLNNFDGLASTAKLDFYAQNGKNRGGGWVDGSGAQQNPVDVILAADIICKPEDAVAAADTIYDALRPG